MAIEIVDSAMKFMVNFHSYVNLPEGQWCFFFSDMFHYWVEAKACAVNAIKR